VKKPPEKFEIVKTLLGVWGVRERWFGGREKETRIERKKRESRAKTPKNDGFQSNSLIQFRCLSQRFVVFLVRFLRLFPSNMTCDKSAQNHRLREREFPSFLSEIATKKQFVYSFNSIIFLPPNLPLSLPLRMRPLTPLMKERERRN
jgi:hypothetical protein